MTIPVHVLGISGSLRQNSYNTALLHAASELLPDGMSLKIADISQIPLYNADLEVPSAVKDFKAEIAAADALLIATPEYNLSIPGVLKNAIDWASHPARQSPLNDKPVALMGAGGRVGTSHAQFHLRQVLTHTNSHPLNRPQVAIQRAGDKFDAHGRLVDEDARQAIRLLLEALYSWTVRLGMKAQV